MQNRSQNEIQKKGKKTLTLILVIALIVGAFFAYKAIRNYMNRPEVNLIHAERASFDRTLSLNAQVEPQDKQLVSSAHELVVEDILVDEGDFVKKGQELYRYSRSDANKQLSKVNEEINELNEKERERQERYEKVFMEVASQLSQQLGVSLKTAMALLEESLSNFDLKDQLKNLLPDSLAELGLNKATLTETINALNRALDASEVTMKEIASLVKKINSTEVTEETKKNLEQLLTQAEELNKQVQKILEIARALLEKDKDLSPDMKKELNATIDRAEEMNEALNKLIEGIKEDLNKLPDNKGENNSSNNSESESGSSENPSDSSEHPSNSENPPREETNTGSHNQPGTEAPANPPLESTPSTLPDLTRPSSSTSKSPDAKAPSTSLAKSNDPEGTSMPAPLGQKLISFFQQPLNLLSQPALAAPAKENKADENLDLSSGDMSQMNPSLLLAMLQMDQNQGQSQKEKLEKDKAELEEMLQGDNLTVKAEMDGLVAKLNVVKDKAVDKGELEALIIDDSNLIATCWVGKQDANRLEKGQEVVYNYDDLDLYGKITYKAAIASPEPSALGNLEALGSQLGLADAGGVLGKNLGSSNPKVEIRMSIEGPDLRRLTIGFDMNGEVKIGEVKDVLSIPIESLVQKRDSYFVYYVDENNVLRSKEIQLGLVGEKRVEVKSGLGEDEAIVINAGSNLKAGQKVKISTENKQDEQEESNEQ